MYPVSLHKILKYINFKCVMYPIRITQKYNNLSMYNISVPQLIINLFSDMLTF